MGKGGGGLGEQANYGREADRNAGRMLPCFINDGGVS